ncbi:hypothetical protein HDU67_006334 [Dinochytrium kinnereticum]|nr:hypothetical protein HDU67_006334 [Dinochytrium kinnereticum]
MPAPRAQPLVSTEWLFDQLITRSSRNVVVLDGTWHLPTLKRNAYKEYLDERIPGARFFDIDEISDHGSSLPHMLPSETQFSMQVGKLGISNQTHLVIYDAVNAIGSAARVLWTFRAFGHGGGVSVLDGGLRKWKAENRPLERGEVGKWEAVAACFFNVAETSYTSKFNPSLVKTFTEMRTNLTTRQHLVIDARPADRFHGTAPEPRPIPSGHMPSSISIPSLHYTNGSNVMIGADEMREMFLGRGVESIVLVVLTAVTMRLTVRRKYNALVLFIVGRS